VEQATRHARLVLERKILLTWHDFAFFAVMESSSKV
jgi:hypothetical protein